MLIEDKINSIKLLRILMNNWIDEGRPEVELILNNRYKIVRRRFVLNNALVLLDYINDKVITWIHESGSYLDIFSACTILAICNEGCARDLNYKLIEFSNSLIMSKCPCKC